MNRSCEGLAGEGARSRRPLPPPPHSLPQSLKLLGSGKPWPLASASLAPIRGLGGGCGGRAGTTDPWPSPPTLLFIFLLLFLLGACGKKGTPLSPGEVLPGPVRDFRLSQEGDSLVLSWLLPRENLLGQPLIQVQGCRLYRAAVPGVQPVKGCPPHFFLLADIDLAYPKVGQVRGEAVVYQDRDLVPDHRYYYKVAAYDQSGYPGTWSRELSHAWGVLPLPPRELKVEAGDRLVQLTWSPVTRREDGRRAPDLAGYFVYRRTAGEEWLRLTPDPLTVPLYQDLAAQNEVDYTYKVRAVRRLGPDWLTSRDSASLTARPVKLTPPPPILNLMAVASARGVELHWDMSPAPDLAGYRVYRRASPERRFTRLTRELLTRPHFLDSQVRRGQTYYYYVTAVDDSPRANESLPSEEAAASY